GQLTRTGKVEWNRLNFADVGQMSRRERFGSLAQRCLRRRDCLRSIVSQEEPVSQFGADKFTTRSREAIEAAQLAATTGGNSQTEPIHLLVARLRQEDGVARSLVARSGIEVGGVAARAEAAQATLPKASGSTVQQPGASAAL